MRLRVIGTSTPATARHRLEDARGRSERQLALQQEVVRAIAGSATLAIGGPQLLGAIARASGWEAAALWVVDEEVTRLRCVAFWHLPELEVAALERETLETRLAEGSGLPGYVWAIRRAAWVAEDSDDSGGPRAETARAAGLHGAVGFPLLAGGQVSGVLELLGREVREPDAELLSLLETLQTQLGQLLERTRADDAIARSHHLLASVVEALPDPVVVKDPEGRYVLVNSAATRADGRSKRELLGRTDFDLLPEERAAELRRHDVEVMETGRARSYEEADGAGRMWLTSKAPLRDGVGRVIGVIAVARDITEQRKAEQALRTSAEQIADLYNNAPCGYHSLGRDGTFLKINDTELAWLGYERGEVVGRLRFPDLLSAPARARFAERFATLKETGRVSDEVELVRKDGTTFPALLDATAVLDESGAFVMSCETLVDVTERKAVEAELRKSESELRQALKMEAVGRLAGGVAHDFNNLLTAILGYSDLLIPELEPDDHRRGDVEEIHRAAERAMALTRQLLAFSRRESLDARPLELNSIVADITSLLRRLIGEDIELETVLGEDVPQIRGDRGQIEQVIVNLAVNAHDAMPAGGRLVIETSNATGDPERAAGSKQYALLSVTDTGGGMNEATLARIFDPYFTTKERGKGTGLGLSTVYGIVDSLSGHVVVDSEPDRGTRFAVYLPALDLAEELEAPDSAEEPLRGSETVLLVEDEKIVRTLTARILVEHGYTVLEAGRGDEALALAADPANEIDLVISDIVMPGMNGLELGERLRRAHPRLRFVFVSGYADSAFGGASSLPVDAAFVEKPFTPPVLLKRVREALDGG